MQHTNVVRTIYTNFMIDHLLDTPNADECPVCRVLNAYGARGLEAPDGRCFSDEDCDCEARREIVDAVMAELGFSPAAYR